MRQHHGTDTSLIAHEDYLPTLLGEVIACFFKHGSYDANTDEAINFLCHNWYRDGVGNDLNVHDGLSIAEVFSTGLLNTVPSVCREYFALKYWADVYDTIYVSCNESASFLNIVEIFGLRVQIYDPGHRQTSPLQSFAERVLQAPKIDARAKLLRRLQRPFLPLLRHKTLALSDWTIRQFSREQGWVFENSRWPWRGAYSRKPPQGYLEEAENWVPPDFETNFTVAHLAVILRRIGVNWDEALVALVAGKMIESYSIYRGYFVAMLAFYRDLLDSYRPTELVLASEFYEPYLLAAQLAKRAGVKLSWLVDGYPVLDTARRVGHSIEGPVMFDRIYAIGNQHKLRLLRSKPQTQEVLTIFPPILQKHRLIRPAEKLFDAIIMTWIPNDLQIQGRNGSRPDSLLTAIEAAMSAGLLRLAVKIKHVTEKVWVIPVLQKAGYLSNVTLLEGSLFDHINSTHRLIGGVSSAVGEATYLSIPYYIYEPFSNGYSAAQLASALIINEGGVARTPAQLRELLNRPEGSVINDRALLFGTDCPHPEWSWDQTRELYTTWAANWADKSGIKSALQWRGFPLWWSSNLIAKDTAVDFAWYQTLHDRLCGVSGKQPSSISPLSHGSVYTGILKSLFKELSKWLLLKFLPKGGRAEGPRVWFHSLEYNLINGREGFCDRMYELAPRDDRKYGFTSAFVIRLNLKISDFLHPLLWRRRILQYAEKLKREVEVLDAHLNFADVVQIHASLIGNYFKFSRIAKQLRREGARVGHAEFSDILILEMQKSFTAVLPWSMSYAAMFERWLKCSGSEKILITYGETLAAMRPVYFLTRNCDLGHRWISIQHATVYRNKMGFYHRHSEFNHESANDKRHISPKPDYYFVHGQQFSKILAEFYPSERIRITGCLKYDSLFNRYAGSRLLDRPSGDPILLLAPSVGDEAVILKMFSGLQALPGWRVLLSKHPTVSREWIDKLIRDNDVLINIEFDASKSTVELVESASLVICSYSGIALESIFVGVPSVRILNPEQPPMVEDEPGIRYVTTQEELLELMSEVKGVDRSTVRTPDISATLERYFYKFDGLASERFWTELGLLSIAKE